MADLQHQPQMAVLGGGAWGTALACVLAQQHASVTLWANEAETVNAINQSHENPQFLPDIPLPAAIGATENLADLAHADIILMVVPAQFARRCWPSWRSTIRMPCWFYAPKALSATASS